MFLPRRTNQPSWLISLAEWVGGEVKEVGVATQAGVADHASVGAVGIGKEGGKQRRKQGG